MLRILTNSSVDICPVIQKDLRREWLDGQVGMVNDGAVLISFPMRRGLIA